MNTVKRIALVAHDNRKKDLVEWAGWNWSVLLRHQLICTGTTGRLIEETLRAKQSPNGNPAYEVRKLKSGPLGGDQQLGALIADGGVDFLIFFWDPMQQQPHDVDVKALLRISVLYNIPTACNRSTADFLISSQLMNEQYEPIITDYSQYVMREVNS